MNRNIYEEAAALKSANKAFAIAAISESKGSTPRSSARMLVREDGTTAGTVGGGPVEQFVIANCLEAIREQKNRTCRYTLQMRENEGMHCGGEMAFFIDVEIPGSSLLLVGAGHVNRAVAQLAVQTGFTVTVADDRKDLLTPGDFPSSASLVFGENLEEAVDKTAINERTYVLVATGSEDKAGLKAVIGKYPAFIAMLGSRRKAVMVRKELAAEGWTEGDLARVVCPAGLDIGAESPEEIAVSLLSQMMMVRTGTGGRELYPSLEVKPLVIVRGAGDIASGTIARLHRSGYRVLALETDEPTVIRRTVSFADAVRKREMTVEGITARLASSPKEVAIIHRAGHIAVAVDPDGKLIEQLKPSAVVDAILAKKNLGTSQEMAPVTIALGPGFSAGNDVRYVVETMRGHSLAKIIADGPALPDTKIPGSIDGYTEERLLRAPADGEVEVIRDIGMLVTKGELLARVGDSPVTAPLTGKVRGMILPGTAVHKGMKIGDVDPRGEKADHLTISDKAYAIGGSVLEILLREGICP